MYELFSLFTSWSLTGNYVILLASVIWMLCNIINDDITTIDWLGSLGYIVISLIGGTTGT